MAYNQSLVEDDKVEVLLDQLETLNKQVEAQELGAFVWNEESTIYRKHPQRKSA